MNKISFLKQSLYLVFRLFTNAQVGLFSTALTFELIELTTVCSLSLSLFKKFFLVHFWSMGRFEICPKFGCLMNIYTDYIRMCCKSLPKLENLLSIYKWFITAMIPKLNYKFCLPFFLSETEKFM